MGTPRTRSSNSFVQQLGNESITNCGNVTTNTTPTLGTIIGNGLYRVMDDVVDDRFKDLQQAGHIFNNPLYSRKTTSAVLSVGSCAWALKPGLTCSPSSTVKSGTHTGTFGLAYNAVAGDSYFTPSFSLSTHEAIAGTSAMANVEEPEVQGFVDLAEFTKTLRMLRNPISQMGSLIDIIEARFKRLRRRNKTDARNLFEFVQANWLQYRYGFVPLLLSIQGVMKILSTPKTSPRKTARGSSTVVRTIDLTGVYNAPASGGFTRTSRITGTKVHTVRAGVLYECETTLGSRYGFGVQEIPSAVWELVQFSFVVDWFFNVGDWIRAVTPKAGVRYLSHWTTSKSEMDYNINVTSVAVNYPYPTSSYNYSGSPGLSFKRLETEVTRSPRIAVELVSKVKEIQFLNKRDFLHAADAIALIGSRLSGRRMPSARV